MATVALRFSNRAAARVAAPRFAVSGPRCAVAGRIRTEFQLPRFPARHISFTPLLALAGQRRAVAATVSCSVGGVAFEELVGLLEAQYGLAERFVRGSLSELAEMLGYHVGMDPIIEYADADILMEEIGAPPLSQQQLKEFKASRSGLRESQAEASHENGEDVLRDGPSRADERSTIVRSAQSGLPMVFVSYSPRLFRGR